MTVSAIHDKSELLAALDSPRADASGAEVSRCPFHRVLGLGRRSDAPVPSVAGTGTGTSTLDLPAPPRSSASRLRQTVRFATDPYNFLREMRREHGDLFALDLLGMGRIVFLCSAKLLHEIYRLDEDSMVAGEVRRKFLGRVTSPLSSLALDGEEYRRRRKITTPWFTGRRVDRWVPVVQRLTRHEVRRWAPGETLSLQEPADRIALRTICHVLFGSLDRETLDHLESLSVRFLEAFQWTTVQITPLQRSFGPWSPWARFERRRARYERLVERCVTERVDAPASEPTDLLGALVEAYREDLESAREHTIEMIVAELVSFIIGGTETTSKAVAWTLLGLFQHPTALERLRAELDEVVGDRPFEPADVNKNLPYLDAVVQEGLRYQPVGPFAGPRMTKKALALGGYRIEPGTILAQCLKEVGFNERFLHPERFEPANFFEREVRPNEWVPFGGGKRICAGMGLAQMEMKVVVATIARCADFEVLGAGADHKPTKSGIAFKPKDGLRVRYLGPRVPGRRPSTAARPTSASAPSSHLLTA